MRIRNSWIKGGKAYIIFRDLTRIYGPMKVYVPSKAAPAYIVQPDFIYQRYPQGGKYLEINFPLEQVGGLTDFDYEAVSVTASDEPAAGSGHVPDPV